MEIVGWLTGCPDIDLPDPLTRADAMTRSLSRQRRYEEAKEVQDACEHLLNVRRSYEALAEAHCLRFAVLWPQANNGDGPCVRLNLVWNGRLREPVSLHPRALAEDIGAALDPLWSTEYLSAAEGAAPLVAVAQDELDLFLAIRRWHHETEKVPKLLIPGPEAERSVQDAFKASLAAQADGLFRVTPDPAGEGWIS
jgi:hypothetical protein